MAFTPPPPVAGVRGSPEEVDEGVRSNHILGLPIAVSEGYVSAYGVSISGTPAEYKQLWVEKLTCMSDGAA